MKILIKMLLIFVYGLLYVCRADRLLGEGKWSLINIGECTEKIEPEIIKFEIEKHKMNRTHDAFDSHVTVNEDIDYTYGAYIEVCKYVYGGCKPQQVITDDSFANLLKKYAEDNKVEVLTLAKVDPPDFPLKKGEYEVKDYIISYCKLPKDGMYGKYNVNAYVLYGEKRVGCMNLVVEFNELEEDEDCDWSD